MSWEGYDQIFCMNGHYFTACEFWSPDYNNVCDCGAKPALINTVDETNCDEAGVIPDEVLKTLIIKDVQTETCNLGHTHVVAEAIYRIPTEEEARKSRHYWDASTRTYKPLED